MARLSMSGHQKRDHMGYSALKPELPFTRTWFLGIASACKVLGQCLLCTALRPSTDFALEPIVDY